MRLEAHSLSLSQSDAMDEECQELRVPNECDPAAGGLLHCKL